MASFLQSAGRYLSSLARNAYFWGGVVGLLLVGILLFVLLNYLALPLYTRHGVAVTVPDVKQRSYAEAVQLLEREGFRVERIVQRFNPELPRDAVVEQSPHPNALVKPGRRVYLTVNSGRVPKVKVPALEGASLREARSRLQAVGLEARDVRPDTIPSPYANTITRQSPAPGDSLPRGAGVTLWYSTGLGEVYVAVPDVTGKPLAEAQQILLANKLRTVVIGLEPGDRPETLPVLRQSREPGTRVKEGFEIRLFVNEAADPEAVPETLAPSENQGGIE